MGSGRDSGSKRRSITCYRSQHPVNLKGKPSAFMQTNNSIIGRDGVVLKYITWHFVRRKKSRLKL